MLVQLEKESESYRIKVLQFLAEVETNGRPQTPLFPSSTTDGIILQFILHELRQQGLAENTSSGPRLTDLGWTELVRYIIR